MKTKKADLSVNTVIIAVLALLVLIVLAFIFSGRLKTFSKGAGECKGECVKDQSAKDKWTKGPCYQLDKCTDSKGTYYETKGYCCSDLGA